MVSKHSFMAATVSDERRCAVCGEILDDRVFAGQLKLPFEGMEAFARLATSQIIQHRHCSLECADAHVAALMALLGQIGPAGRSEAAETDALIGA